MSEGKNSLSDGEMYKIIVNEKLAVEEAAERFNLTVENVEKLVSDQAVKNPLKEEPPKAEKEPPETKETPPDKAEDDEFHEDDVLTENSYITSNLGVDLNMIVKGLMENFKITRSETISKLVIYKESFPRLWGAMYKDEAILNKLRGEVSLDLDKVEAVDKCPICGTQFTERIGKYVAMLYVNSSMPVSDLFKKDVKKNG